MEELIYLSVRIACAFYLLAKVYGWRKRIAGICSLLYGKTSQEKDAARTDVSVSSSEDGIIGASRYVYLDEDAGKTVAPFMSQPLESNFIGEEEEVRQEDVECSLPLERMKLLREEQESLDMDSPVVENISLVLSLKDMELVGEVLAAGGAAGEEKALQAARVLFTIRQTSLFDVFVSDAENSEMVEYLIERYLDEDGTPRKVKVRPDSGSGYDWRSHF